MRKVTYGGAVSLDGYLAGPGEAIDWLLWSDDSARIMRESWVGVDSMLMGRKTYDFAVRSGKGPATPGIKTYVFSRSMKDAPDGVELVRDDAAGFVKSLKARPGGDIIVMGGGELGSALVEGGAVDVIGLNVHPILLGGGIPAFRELAGRVPLELLEARPLQRGCVLLLYRVAA